MENTVNSKQQELKWKIPIKVLSIASIVFTLLSSISYFVVYYSSWGIGGEIDSMAFRVPQQLGEIVSLIAQVILPALLMGLFAIYIFVFYKKKKAKSIPLTIFLALEGLVVIELLGGFIFGFWPLIHLGGGIITDILFRAAFYFIPFILAAISALSGFNKKILFAVGMAFAMFLTLLGYYQVFGRFDHYLSQGLYAGFCCKISEFLGICSFYVALLLFGLKNRIPAIIPQKAKNKTAGIFSLNNKTQKFNPAQALKELKEDFEMGIITEEEYNTKRAEILSKL